MRYEDKRVLRRRQKGGEKWLDKQLPGWFRRISVNNLDISDPYTCVLGQTGKLLPLVRKTRAEHLSKNGYDAATSAYDYLMDDDTKYGFYGEDAEADSYLTELWQHRIIVRKIESGQIKADGRLAKRFLVAK
jgi:hypothetical protein